jgi:hypothetical protein
MYAQCNDGGTCGDLNPMQFTTFESGAEDPRVFFYEKPMVWSLWCTARVWARSQPHGRPHGACPKWTTAFVACSCCLVVGLLRLRPPGCLVAGLVLLKLRLS